MVNSGSNTRFPLVLVGTRQSVMLRTFNQAGEFADFAVVIYLLFAHQHNYEGCRISVSAELVSLWFISTGTL